MEDDAEATQLTLAFNEMLTATPCTQAGIRAAPASA
jgi:hypothetical protein